MSGFLKSKNGLTALIAVTVVGVVGYALYARTKKEREEATSSEEVDKFSVVFVLGGPGSGKGTNCTKIVEKFGYTHLSAGDLLREERNSGSKLAEMINDKIKAGQIVPAEVTVNLLHQAMLKSAARQFLIDGFPRDPDNLSCWDEKMSKYCDVKFMLYLECPEETMMERLIERGKTSGRNDDNPESIRKRFQTYIASTQPIIQKFRDLGKLREVNSNRDEAAVFADVCKFFKYTAVFVLGGPGSGKGTNCTKIVEKFGYTHLSAGDLLREERNSGSKLAEMINNKIKEGEIVPAEVTVGLLYKAMINSDIRSGARQFLIDGFPRDPDNLSCWEKKMNEHCDVKFMLYLECPEETMMERLIERGKTSGRNDDNPESIRKRFQTYIASTQPIIQKFRDLGKLREVNSNRDEAAVFTDVAKVFAK